MQLIPLWDTNIKKSYHLHNQFKKDENGFMNPAYQLDEESFKDYVQLRKNYSMSIGLPDGFVADTVFILEDQGNYVGIFNLRHYLNDALKNGGGHIGYGIAPEYRGRHYATKGLALLIQKGKDIIEEDEFYLSVFKNNTASLNVQFNNHAIIDHEDDSHYYTRIKFTRK
ncbi:MAG: GNAT family N-acetyltransferase [Erysipelotrichaceae bacterium]